MLYTNIINKIVAQVKQEHNNKTTQEQNVYCLYLNYLQQEQKRV